ncbi:MAG TPA: hypothetical protein VF017_08770 [Thermoanaerobaculia bacterium]|nr:hypothetical protein [Thermoanaerobaculia bacterium]
MNRSRSPRSTWLGLAALLLAAATMSRPASAQIQPPAPPDHFDRMYLIRYLSLPEAETLVWEQCPKEGRAVCRVTSAGRNEVAPYLMVDADAATHAKIARALMEKDGVPRTHTFRATLLVASREGGKSGAIPEAIRKVVEDLKGFLPYASYRTLDTVTITTSRGGSVKASGPDGLPVDVRIFMNSQVGDQLEISGFEVQALGASTAEDGRAKGRKLIESTFSMRIGESLVVGTSALDGGQEALVVVLTAVS